MLRPQLTVADLRDHPNTLRVTDATTGYGQGGNPARPDITRATLAISRYSVSGLRVVSEADLPLASLRAGTAIDMPYPEGDGLGGDGLIVLTYSIYSTLGEPLTVATYVTDHPAPYTAEIEQIFLNRNGAWERLTGQATSENWTYAITATTDIYTGWRIVGAISGQVLRSGLMVSQDAFWSQSEVSTTPRPAPILIARAAQPLLLLARTRRRLNQLSERLVYDERTPLAQHLSDSLMWLRLYEQLAELELGDLLDHSPVRVQIILADIHIMLKSLWLRHG